MFFGKQLFLLPFFLLLSNRLNGIFKEEPSEMSQKDRYAYPFLLGYSLLCNNDYLDGYLSIKLSYAWGPFIIEPKKGQILSPQISSQDELDIEWI